jgi:homoserine dehydrogenase
MSEAQRIPLIVFGVGNVGRTFLSQLAQTHLSLARRYGVDLRPVALAEIDGVIFDPDGLLSDTLETAINARERGESFADLPNVLTGLEPLDVVKHAAESGIEDAIVVDITAADGMESAHRHALELGYGVALANKRPMAGPWTGARIFFEHPRMRFEATVGAGLPVITTLRYLVDTGDVVKHIEGAFSGTLGFLCSQLEDGEAFSRAVKVAKDNRYTEPDPRDDLGGMDVARKALILGRLAGWQMEMDDLRVEPLYPDEMADLSVDDFMTQLPRLDGDFAAYMGALAGIPRYMAEVTPKGGSVGLRMVDQKLAAQLRGTLNLAKFTTQRYAGDNAMELIGPGAGLEVTAAAVLQDCVQLSRIMA